MSSVGPRYQGQAKRGHHKMCALGHERHCSFGYRTMQPLLGFDSTVKVTSCQHSSHVPNSGLVKSGNVMEKINELTSAAGNWLCNMCPRQTSRHLAKDSAATIPIFFSDLFSSNYSMSVGKRMDDNRGCCGNISRDSLSTVKGWGAPYHRNNFTRHYCSKRKHTSHKQIPVYPSNMFANGFLTSFVQSNFPSPTELHNMDRSKGSQNCDATNFCKHRCVMEDVQLEKLAEEAKLKPYNTYLRFRARLGQKCSVCHKYTMESQSHDPAVTRKEERDDVSSKQGVNRSTGNHEVSYQWTPDAQICNNFKTCDTEVTGKDTYDEVFSKQIVADKPTGNHIVNLQQMHSSSVNDNLKTCDIISESKEDYGIDTTEKDYQIDWFEYSKSEGCTMLIPDHAIQPSLPVKKSKPIDTQVVDCNSDSQTLNSCEKRNENKENKSAILHSWLSVEELTDSGKTPPKITLEDNSLSTPQPDCKVASRISCDSSSNGKEDDEQVSTENSKKLSDSVLYVRKCSGSKKTRPSSKKRRRQKAKLQQVPQHCRNNPAKDENLNGSKTVAFKLRMDSSPNNSQLTHSFVVSYDDGDSDWSDSDDFDCSPEETDQDFLCELQNSFGLMGFKVTCSLQSEPQTNSRQKECTKHDLDAINMSWKINIPLNECPTRMKSDKRKVHFADDKNLVTIHPMVAWSYAYATARKGPWEEYARDRDRFQRRIEEAESVLTPILEHSHRSTICKKYFKAE